MYAKKYFISSTVVGLFFSFLFLTIDPASYVSAGEGLSPKKKVSSDPKSTTHLVDRLIEAMQYGDEKEREDAVIALGMIGNKRAVDPLCEYLEHTNDRNMRIVIVRALGRIGSPKAAPILMKILKEGDYEFSRIEAAWALGEIGDNDAIGALEEGLKDNSFRVRRRCAQILEQITGKEYEYEGKESISTFEGYYKRLEELKSKHKLKPTPEE